MKKIVFYIKGIYNGGTEVALLNLITILDKTKYDIYIVNDDFNNSSEIVVEKMRKYANIIELQNIEADILVYCTAPKSDVGNIISNIKYKKSFFWFHYFSENQLNFLSQVNKEKLVDGVIVVCETIKKRILNSDIYEGAEDNITVIYNILLDEEIYKKSNEEVQLDLSDNLNLVTVARLCKAKGFYRMKYLIDCFIEKNIDFKWHILGCASNKNDDEEINNMINCYPGRVIMHGYQENPYKYISKCDYLVLLSDEENMPYTVVEAKALGVPCILTNFDSAYEQVEDMRNGIILDRDNLETYKEKIQCILENKLKLKKQVEKYKYSNTESMNKWYELFN